jgi:hypothetical protein
MAVNPIVGSCDVIEGIAAAVASREDETHPAAPVRCDDPAVDSVPTDPMNNGGGRLFKAHFRH